VVAVKRTPDPFAGACAIIPIEMTSIPGIRANNWNGLIALSRIKPP